MDAIGEELPMADIFLTPDSIDSINEKFNEKLLESQNTPEEGFAAIQEILADSNITVPSISDMDEEGGEFVINLADNLYLYFIYGKTDDEKYEFYVELTDDEGVDEILSDEEEEQDE